MIGREFAEEPAKRFFGRVWEDAVGYLRLYEFLKLGASKLVGASPLRLRSVAEFWHGVLGDRFGRRSVRYHPVRDGDVVSFRLGCLTDWAPKLPGRLWTSDGAADLTEGIKMVEGRRRYSGTMYTILDPYGKRRVLDAGHGTVRLAHGTRDSDTFAYMALVDEQDWNCDYGIPIIVSKPVFDVFQKYSRLGAAAVKSLEGVVRIGSDLPLSQLIPRAVGAELSKASEDSLRLRPGLPRCYVHVVSPLSVKLLYGDSHPDITAWTMYASRHSRPASSRHEPFGYTYATINPRDRDAHDDAATFLKDYASDHGGARLITDYDGIVPRLAAEIPLVADPFRTSKAAVRKLFRGIDRWAERAVGRHS